LRNSERAESARSSGSARDILARFSYDYHISAKLSTTDGKTNGGSPSSSPLELLAVLTDGWTGDTEEHENSTIQSHDVCIGKPAHIAADPRLWNRRDFVRH
jgi:hypothetical protein